MDTYPGGPRALSALAALALAAGFGVLYSLGLAENGYVLSAYVGVATAIPPAAFLLWLALDPASMQRALSRVSRVDLRQPPHVGALVVLVATMYFVLGFGSLVNGMLAYEHEVVLGRESPSITGTAILVGVFVNVIVLVAPVLFYLAVVRDPASPTPWHALGLRREGAERALGIGAASAIGVIMVIALVSLAVQGLRVEVPENERALEIARSVTVTGAFALAVGAALSEEIFFRGFLQPRIGLWGQAVFFALAHLSYVNVLEVVVTFVLALLFGVIYRWTGNLWAPIAGHFVFNLIMLLAGIYAPETPG